MSAPTRAADPLTAALARVPTVDDLEALERVKALHPTWPPPVRGPGGSPSRGVGERGNLLRAVPAPLGGCRAGDDGMPCLVLRAPRVRCASCGTITEVAAGRAGPQLLTCPCAGPDGAVCAHPPGTPPPVARTDRDALRRVPRATDDGGPA